MVQEIPQVETAIFKQSCAYLGDCARELDGPGGDVTGVLDGAREGDARRNGRAFNEQEIEQEIKKARVKSRWGF